MFGYVTPDRPHLFIKDETLYQALYCGMCKSIGKGCGLMARTTLTYDMAFMSALLHNASGCDVTIERRRCFLHLIKRRPMAKSDELSVLLGCINCALAYFKLLDDKADGDKKGIFSFLYKKGYKRALKRHPALGDIIKEQTDEQRRLETAGCDIIDMACEPSALMMKGLCEYALGEKCTPQLSALCYDIGKWVYLADALDDYDKDVKKGRYNVLYNVYKKPTKKQAVEAGEEELKLIFNSLFADMRENLSKVRFYFNHDLTDNIILMGIPQKSRTLMYGCGRS